MADQWFYSRGGQQTGPVSLEVLRQMAARGELTPADLVWREGMPEWQPIGSLPEFGGRPTPVPYAPPPGPLGPMPYQQPPAQSYQGMAIAGFVLSLLGIPFCCGIVFGPVGAILGFTARSGMDRTGNQQGRGLATAAIIIGIIAFVFHLIVIPFQWQIMMHRIYRVH